MTNEKDLELINALARKKLTADEVFTFNLTLCDNDIDRDFERFSEGSLLKLQELFRGKTGISDHSMRSKDQAFRLYDTYIKKDETKRTATGEAYIALMGKAYTVKTESNATLLEEIDAGIKKEVSISCSVQRSVCSICGKDMKKHECTHVKGKTYKGKLCYGTLEEPTDAYEWSFVAVPAQRQAGVTKSFRIKEEKNLKNTVDALKSASGEVTLSEPELKALRDYIENLELLSKEAETYKNHLTEEIERLMLIAMPKVDCKQFSKGCKEMALGDLRALRDSLKAQAAEALPISMQLKPASTKATKTTNTEFKL